MRKFLLGLVLLPALAGAAVSTSTSSVSYVCSNLGPYTVNFKFLSSTHLEVRVNEQLKVLGVDYSVAGAGADNGGSITFLNECVPGQTIKINREVPLVQDVTLQTQGKFSPKTHETAFDKLTMMAQQVDRKTSDVAATHAADKALQAVRDSNQDSAIVSGDASVVSQLASNLAAIIASGPPGSPASNSTVLATGGSLLRPLKDHLGDRLNIKDFGCVADATRPGGVETPWFGTDNAACIQAAIDVSKPTDTGSHHEGRCVYIPRGDYGTASPIKIYTGTCLVGDGPGSRIVALNAHPGTSVLIGDSLGQPDGYVSYVRIRELGIHGHHLGLWALNLGEGAVSGGTGYLSIDGLTFWTNKGLKLDAYTQGANVKRVNSMGPVDQFMILEGNWNTFESLDKEGSVDGHTGSTADPYFLIRRTTSSGLSSDSNSFKHILIEQVCSPNKSLFVVDGTYNLSVHDIWFECTASDGYALRLDDSADFQFSGNLSLLYTDIESGNGHEQKIEVTGGSWGVFETLNANAVDDSLQNVLEVDSTSYVSIDNVYTRRGKNLRAYDNPNLHINRAYEGWSINGLTPGIVSGAQVLEAGSDNILVNPGFEAGHYGWFEYGFAPGNALVSGNSYLSSEVGYGRMLQVHSMSGGNKGIIQRVTIPAEWVGKMFTFSILAKTTGNNNIWASPYLDCTTAPLLLANVLNPVEHDTGWHLMNVAFRPAAAGTCDVGVWIYGTTNAGAVVYLDDARLAFGKVGQPDGASWRTIHLNGNTYGSSSAAPDSTWSCVKGDIVFNSQPDPGEPAFWQCTVDGTTWQAALATLRGTVTVDLGNIAGNACGTKQQIALSGAVVGNECATSLPPGFPDDFQATCHVDSPNVVDLHVCNNGAGPYDPPSNTYSVRVFK